MGLATPAYAQLLRLADFHARTGRGLPEGAFGPPEPPRWRWRPARRQETAPARPVAQSSGAFAALAELVR
jgi:ATP-dependent RNA helicase SUPV3L1/SUV3